MSQERMVAKPAQGETSTSSAGSSRRTPPPDAAPEEILDEIRAFLRRGDVLGARRLASEGAERHPDHAELVNARRVLCEGRSYTKPGTGRNTHAEYEWLRDPPERYRGKWVALVGSEVIASADTHEELVDSLPKNLPATPLAVQIAS